MEEMASEPSESPAVSIRPMRMADLDDVLALAGTLPTAPQWPRQAYVEALDPESRPLRIGLVAESAGQMRGFLLLSLLPPEAELESIAVAPESQRQGTGRALLQAGIAASRAAGCATLLLEIRASNTPAAALYQRAGFREIGRRRGYYAHPAEDALLMQLSLSRP